MYQQFPKATRVTTKKKASTKPLSFDCFVLPTSMPCNWAEWLPPTPTGPLEKQAAPYQEPGLAQQGTTSSFVSSRGLSSEDAFPLTI